MTDRLEQVRGWMKHLGTGGAVANARDELERRAVEHAIVDALAGRVPALPTPAAEAA